MNHKIQCQNCGWINTTQPTKPSTEELTVEALQYIGEQLYHIHAILQKIEKDGIYTYKG